MAAELSPAQARQLRRKAAAELRTTYESAIVDTDHWRDPKTGKLKTITRAPSAMPLTRCLYCDGPLDSKSMRKRFCSDACAQANYRRMKR
jgi:hypothetical protein